MALGTFRPVGLLAGAFGAVVWALGGSCADGYEPYDVLRPDGREAGADVDDAGDAGPDAGPDVDETAEGGPDAVAPDTVICEGTSGDPGPDVPPLDCADVPGSIARGWFEPAAPTAPERMVFHLEAPEPWTNLEVTIRDAWGALLTPHWIGVDGAYHWRWYVDPTVAGLWCVTVRTDPSSTLRWRGTVRIAAGGTPDGGPDDGGVEDAGPEDVGPDVPPGTFVSVVGTEFMAGTSRLRFIGVNLRGLPHFGTPQLPYAPPSTIESELDAAQGMGVRVVRVFAAANDADPATVAARLGRVLDGAAARGMWVIVALTDFYPTGLFPRGDEGMFGRSPDGYTILTADFFRSGYRINYLPWVREVVGRYGSHPAVFAWELGNEIKCDGDHAAFFAFVDEVGGVIRSLAPRHLVTIGMITSRWLSDGEARDLYRRPVVDFATVHDYNGAHTFTEFERSVATDVGKPLFVEEAGFESGDRAASIDADIRYNVDTRGLRGYMQWGFMSGPTDNGNGDRQFGMDRVFHSDWDALYAVYRAAADRIR